MVSCPHPVIPSPFLPPEKERSSDSCYGVRSYYASRGTPVPSFDRSYRHDVDDRKRGAPDPSRDLYPCNFLHASASAACCK